MVPASLQPLAPEQTAQSTWGPDLALQRPRERHRHQPWSGHSHKIPQQLKQTSPKPEPWIGPSVRRDRAAHYSAKPNAQTFRHTSKETREEGLKPQRAKGLKLLAGLKVKGSVADFPDFDGLLSQHRPRSRLNRHVYGGLLAGLEFSSGLRQNHQG